MSEHFDRLFKAGRQYMGKMDLEDMAALKIGLLAMGTLAGLSMKNKTLRRMAGVSCTILAAGLTIPLTASFLDEYANTPAVEACDSLDTENFDVTDVEE